LILINSFDILN